MLYQLLPCAPACVNDPSTPGREVSAEAFPWVPFAPRYLFVDPADALLVVTIQIGQRHTFAGAGDVPARVFELRQLARVAGDLRAMIDDGAPLTIEVNEAPAWPLPLELPAITPGVLARVVLRPTDHAQRVIRCAFAGAFDDRNAVDGDPLYGSTFPPVRLPGVPTLPPIRRRRS